MRNVPLLLEHYRQHHSVPMNMATGFAGFLEYMQPVRREGNRYFGERNGKEYEIKDDSADYFYTTWKDHSPTEVVDQVLTNRALWETDLAELPGFRQAVLDQLLAMRTNGVLSTIAELADKKMTV